MLTEARPRSTRFATTDDIWLSTPHGRESGCVAVHEYHRREHEMHFHAVEAIAKHVDGRPYWGCTVVTARSLSVTCTRHGDFVARRDKLGPAAGFGNAYLTQVLGG